MTMVTEQTTEQTVAVGEVPVPRPERPRRVVLKLSGEVFGGGAVGVDPDDEPAMQPSTNGTRVPVQAERSGGARAAR